ncbi:MAG: hypothetical protein LBS31_11115 [Candidatus Adiutrix sp.]|jgi:hypothetical protein|nr:hypothetical protein [Candidatus Adiutrix sp.]
MTHRNPTPDVGEFHFILFPTDAANVNNDALKKIFISMTGNDDYELIEKGGVTRLNGQEKPLRMFECIWNKTIPCNQLELHWYGENSIFPATLGAYDSQTFPAEFIGILENKWPGGLNWSFSRAAIAGAFIQKVESLAEGAERLRAMLHTVTAIDDEKIVDFLYQFNSPFKFQLNDNLLSINRIGRWGVRHYGQTDIGDGLSGVRLSIKAAMIVMAYFDLSTPFDQNLKLTKSEIIVLYKGMGAKLDEIAYNGDGLS